MTTTIIVLVLILALIAGAVVYLYLAARKIRNMPEVPASSRLTDLNPSNFQQHTRSGVVLIDFWASWCMPCKMIGPTVAQIAETYRDKIKVGKLNVDDQGDIASQYGIISIPTLIVFKEGQVARQKVGAMPRQEIEKLFKDLI
jgi:thioredoxin 1